MNTLTTLQIEAEDAALATNEHFKEHRIRHTERLVLRGIAYSQLITELCGKFNVCRRTAESYVAEANRRIKEANAKERELDIAIAKARYETIMYHAFEDRQWTAATNANNALVKLLGLAEPERVEHGAGNSLVELVSQIRQGQLASAASPDEHRQHDLQNESKARNCDGGQ